MVNKISPLPLAWQHINSNTLFSGWSAKAKLQWVQISSRVPAWTAVPEYVLRWVRQGKNQCLPGDDSWLSVCACHLILFFFQLQGDTGSPLVFPVGKRGSYELHGIVSPGFDCPAHARGPGVYSDVHREEIQFWRLFIINRIPFSEQLAWIKEVTGLKKDGCPKNEELSYPISSIIETMIRLHCNF